MYYYQKNRECTSDYSWLEIKHFIQLINLKAKNREAYYTVCIKKIIVASLGINPMKATGMEPPPLAALNIHSDRLAVFVLKLRLWHLSHLQQLWVNDSPSSAASDLRMALTGKPMQMAEVIWSWRTVVNHHSPNSNKGPSLLANWLKFYLKSGFLSLWVTNYDHILMY